MRYQYLATTGSLNKAGAGADGIATWRGLPVAPAVTGLIPAPLALALRVVPIALQGETVLVAALDPKDIALADRISALIARKVKLVRATREELDSVLGQPGHFMGGHAAYSAPSPDDRTIDEPGPAATHAASRSRSWGAMPRSVRTLSETGAVASGLDSTLAVGGPGVFTYVVEEGQRVLMRRTDGTIEVLVGPKRVWRGKNRFTSMNHFVAHPGDYLIVRYRDGRQDHLPGPSEVWFDPRVHQEITREEALQIAAKEAVVVYSGKEGTSTVQRRIEYGPTLFMPRPGEWLHTFAWHSSEGGAQGVRKVARGLVFQKIWLLPDQMYHDVTDVRTADDAVLTIRLMLFFELIDIATMLETTHDPIGDFVNAATSDVVDFTGRHDFESFKRNTDKLNELETYRQLLVRANQCGYRINKVVYRGYGAPERLQLMHDQAIEARTRLQLDRATEQQAQDLENFRLDSQLLRAGKRRGEQTGEVEHELELASRKQEADLRDQEARLAFERQQARLEAELQQGVQGQRDTRQRDHLTALRELNVDLTAYLTQGRADRVIELRGPNGSTHVHLDPSRDHEGPA